MRLQQYDPAPDFTVTDIFDNPLQLADFDGRPLMLSFYRYAGCPLCNLRIQELIERYPDLHARGLNVLSFFQSPVETCREFVGQQDAPFPIVADPEHKVYRLYGVESSNWGALVAGGPWNSRMREANRAGFTGGPRDGDIALVPADFLIGPDLKIADAFYGKTIADHMPFEQIEHFLQNGQLKGQKA